MSSVIPLGWRGGVNQLVAAKAVRDDQLASAKNCYAAVEGQLAKREAMTYVASITGLTGGGNTVGRLYPLTFFKPDPIAGFNYLLNYISQSGGANVLVAVRENEQFNIPPGSVDSPYAEVGGIATYPSGPAVMTNHISRTIITVPGYEGYWQFYNDNGTWKIRRNSFQWLVAPTGAMNTQKQTIDVCPRVCVSYRGRMVYANFGPGYENVIVFTDRSPPVGWANVIDAPPWSVMGDDVLASNGRNFRISSIQGETIRAMMEISTSHINNPLQTALLVLTEKSCLPCMGEPSETTDTGTTFDSYLGDFTYPRVNYAAGVAGPYAICRGPNGTFWANGEDVFALYDGYPKPVPIGTNIRKALAAAPIQLHSFWHMTYADGALYLSIPTAGSSNEVQHAVHHYRLDLRPIGDANVVQQPGGPAEARWWGPMDYSESNVLGGAGDDTTNNERGSLSAAILTVKQNGRDSVRGLFMGDRNANGDKGLHVVEFNASMGGRDIPYKEVLTGRDWAANDYVPVGDIIKPSPTLRNGRLYVATTSVNNHLTGAVEPVWSVVNGGVVVDNDITWTEITGAGTNVRLPNYYGSTAPRISMEPDFKELDAGNRMVDKVAKRSDVSALFDVRQQAWLEMSINHGNLRAFMGPCTIGDFTLGNRPAYNDLGLAQLDVSALAEEFQARQLRPSFSTNRAKLDAIIPWIVRGRTLQPKFREGSGFIVDESNDYIVWCSVNPGGLQTVQQAQLQHGYYANVDALLTVVKAALNTGVAMMGFTTGANPWNYDSAFAAVYPYMTTLTLTFSARTAGHVVGFLGKMDPDDEVTYNGVPFYVGRCARLLAMLGYDTGEAINDAIGFTPTLDTSEVNFIPELLATPLASPTRIAATQSVPYHWSPVVVIDHLEVDLVVKRGRPMPLKGRQS